jgi:NAD(P)-dependent dehydrogenase (short-subunit alcohol dehydrogenase family)
VSRARSVFITGAGSGLGQRMALAFGAAGYAVGVTGIEGTRETAAEIRGAGATALALDLDVRDPAQVDAAVLRMTAELGGIDVLVCNAGIEGPTAAAEEVVPADWNETLAVNLTGAFLCDRAVIPAMAARGGGSIIHIASIAGLQAYPLRSPYAVSKWGLIGLTQTLAAELGASNVRVNAVCPGPVQGDRMRRVIEHRAEAEGRERAEVEADYRGRTALGRLVEADDVVELVLFLASDAAKNITGQAIRVCAGYGL